MKIQEGSRGGSKSNEDGPTEESRKRKHPDGESSQEEKVRNDEPPRKQPVAGTGTSFMPYHFPLRQFPGNGTASGNEMDEEEGSSRGKTGGNKQGKKRTAGNRYDNSLGALTKKFTSLINNSPDGILDLNAATGELNVQKRRIYDITNVLEGIGLIEKRSKNRISWKGVNTSANDEVQEEINLLKRKIDEVHKKEVEIDGCIDLVTRQLTRQAQSDNQDMYLCEEDIRSLSSFRDSTVIAIKAPSGTTLEVPDPDECGEEDKKSYQIFLNSDSGPIEVFVMQHEDLDASSGERPTGSRGDSQTRGEEGDIVKLDPSKNDPDYTFDLEDDEGISDFFVS